MASIIKVDTIQKPDGTAPSASDLGLVLNKQDIPLDSSFLTLMAARTNTHSVSGDSGWVDHLSLNFTVTRNNSSALFIYSSSSSYESGPVEGFARLILDGNMIGNASCVAKESTANSAGSGTVLWDAQYLSTGAHTVKIQIRNSRSSSTWITPYWNPPGESVGNTLGVIFYGR